MKRTMKYIAAACLSLATMSVAAQGFRSTYFLEGSTYRHEMNPSFMGERNYVAIPILGQFGVGVQSNVGVSSFLFKLNDPASKYNLTTFLHPSVSASEFLGGLDKHNFLNMDFSLPIISFGFHKWGGFNTFGLNLRASAGVNLPYELFEFAKCGQIGGQTTTYNFKDLTVRANAYAEVALGHARPVNDNLTVGGKLKFLVGGANANAYIKNAHIQMSDDKWLINLEGQADVAVNGAMWETKTVDVQVDGKTEQREKIDGFDFDGGGPNGFGLAIDLGATYKMDDFVEGLTLSASLTDLGFIRWNKNLVGQNDGRTKFEFDGFHNLKVMDGEHSTSSSKDIDDQLDDLQDDLEAMAQFYDGGVNSRTSTLNANLFVGAEYEMPFYRNLSVAFLMTSHFNKPFTWTEGRFYANVAPAKWFDASINYGVSKFGHALGWVLNFHPKGFNFFIGSDHMITKVTPQFVPVNKLNANFNMGFNITFGNGPKKKA